MQFGVGPATEAKMHRLGIRSGTDLKTKTADNETKIQGVETRLDTLENAVPSSDPFVAFLTGATDEWNK